VGREVALKQTKPVGVVGNPNWLNTARKSVKDIFPNWNIKIGGETYVF
jgi:hypothetical protein